MNKTLNTNRLLLRPPTIVDIQPFQQLANNPKIAEQLFSFDYPFTEAAALSWVNNSWEGFKTQQAFRFVITLKEDSSFLGAIGLHPNREHNHAEIGYWIGEPHWRKGYGSEALKAIIKFAFEEVGLNKVFAEYFLDNPSSGRIMEKCGMIKEAELIEEYKMERGYLSVGRYRLTKSEYLETL